MADGMGGTLVRIAGFAVAIVMVLVACRLRRLPLKETLALRWPSPRAALLWLGLFALLVAALEGVGRLLGVPPVEPWTQPAAVTAVRLLGIVILAPVAEELIFRGLLFTRLRATRAGAPGAVILTAVLFAAFHLQYSPAEMTLVLIDGLFYGLVRWRTDSTFLTIAMHAAGNLLAVWQRLG